MQAMETMDYSFIDLQFLLLQCLQGVPYIALKRGNGGSIRAISRHMEGQESSGSDTHEGKLQKYLDLCTHPDVRGFEVKSHVYTQVWD